MKAIQLCADPLYHLAKLWCPMVSEAKSPPVPVIRAEASSLMYLRNSSLCHIMPYPKRQYMLQRYIVCFPIDSPHVQVVAFRELLGHDDDPVLVYLDSWGLRRLFSLAIRRRSASRRKRDEVAEKFFELLIKHWGHVKSKKGKGKAPEPAEEDDVVAVIDSECDADDLTGIRLEKDGYSPAKSKASQDAGIDGNPLDLQDIQAADDQVEDWAMDLEMEEQLILERIALLQYRCK